ncbi:DUF3576 domain-containing protein [Rhodobaculum claviforme]|uniref:DUF3576 domain-containing protein n=1 Tax=Rhodobaculum claviforme TaxID=1549854 RepID=A0A934TGT1_9RHOB|nr:DUF3576 domain-containing protein [Rhodobaculum claviforme]MBK5926149.1 hypothetical protein [Rhodobaculum claviforme]
MAVRRQAQTWSGWLVAGALTASLAGCGGGGWFGGSGGAQGTSPDPTITDGRDREAALAGSGTVWDLFVNASPPDTTVEVNRYLWNAALEVLDFLPVETVDPFSGVIVTGFGTPPGGGRAYRAAVLVNDPAMDARSINVALMTRAGPADPATVRAIEDAIMTRARQLRVRDGRL